MAILSGCDYMASLPGIGLAKACKFLLKTEETDMKKALMKIPAYLNMRHLVVTDEYIDSFLKAEATFKHMVVYDPINRQLTRLTDPKIDGTNIELLCNAGDILNSDVAFQLALGNLDPFTLKKLDDWNPDNRTFSTNDKKRMTKHKSMWQPKFESHNPLNKSKVLKIPKKVEGIKQFMFVNDVAVNEEVNITQLLSIYGNTENNDIVEPPTKRNCISSIKEPKMENISSPNPFKLKLNKSIEPPPPPLQNSRSFLQNIKELKCEAMPKEPINIKLKKLSKFPRTVLNEKSVVLSRFFPAKPVIVPEPPIVDHISMKVEEISEKYEKQEADVALAYSSSDKFGCDEVSVIDLSSYKETFTKVYTVN